VCAFFCKFTDRPTEKPTQRHELCSSIAGTYKVESRSANDKAASYDFDGSCWDADGYGILHSNCSIEFWYVSHLGGINVCNQGVCSSQTYCFFGRFPLSVWFLPIGNTGVRRSDDYTQTLFPIPGGFQSNVFSATPGYGMCNYRYSYYKVEHNPHILSVTGEDVCGSIPPPPCEGPEMKRRRPF